jgi:hypothetical protein
VSGFLNFSFLFLFRLSVVQWIEQNIWYAHPLSSLSPCLRPHPLPCQLSLQGINALNEDSSFEDPDLMVRHGSPLRPSHSPLARQMEIFELRESIDDLRSSRDQEGAKNLLLELNDIANSLCDTIEVSPLLNLTHLISTADHFPIPGS